MIWFCDIFGPHSHYSIPLVPEYPGQRSFQGRIVHSHDYRHAEDFKDARVLCLGAGASGQDIALDLASSVKQVTKIKKGFGPLFLLKMTINPNPQTGH